MERLRIVAFAAGYRRVGAILVDGNQVKDWKMSTNAALDCSFTKKFTQKMIDKWQPHVVVTENVERTSRKGIQSKQVISVIASVAEDNPLLDVSIERQQPFENKYKEAAHFVSQYPVLAKIQPVRRIFDCEPRSTVIFEALSLAENVKRDPTQKLAAAMG